MNDLEKYEYDRLKMANDELIQALSDARLVIQTLIEEPRMAGVPIDEYIHGIDSQLTKARGTS